MFGESSSTIDEQGGLIPRMVSELLKGLGRKPDSNPGFVSWKMEMSVVEIYNENVRDIMASEGASVLTSSALSEDSWTRIDSRSGQPLISKHDIKTKEDAMDAINSSYTRRVVEATAMNEVSSRSHCIISLHVQQLFSYRDTDDNEFQLKARVNLVDLAGCERGRTRKVNANDDREEEAIYINKSLLVLNQVIFKRSEGKRHAPIRESTLTRLLENSLGGNAFTVLMVNLSPSPSDYGETLNSLGYAKRAKRIQNTVVQNADDVRQRALQFGTHHVPAPAPDWGKPVLGDGWRDEDVGGKEFDKRYILKGKLGEGGYGKVFTGVHKVRYILYYTHTHPHTTCVCVCVCVCVRIHTHMSHYINSYYIISYHTIL